MSQTLNVGFPNGTLAAELSLHGKPKPQIGRLNAGLPRSTVAPYLHPGFCDNCCEQVDDYHCRGTRPSRLHTVRLPLLSPPRSWGSSASDYPYHTYRSVAICDRCYLAAGDPVRIPLDHVTGHHALNSWLFDNHGQWVPRNYRLDLHCNACGESHQHLLYSPWPWERRCVACYVANEKSWGL